MNQVVSLFKSIRRQTVLTAICYIILGVFFLIRPDIAVTTLLQVAAVILFVVGVVRVIAYFAGGKDTVFSGGFTSGTILAAIAAIVFFKTSVFEALLVILLAAAVLLDGITKLQSAIDLARSGFKSWWIVLLLAVVNVALGVVLVINPFATTRLFIRIVGAFMIAGSIGDLVSCVLCSKALRNVRKAATAADGDSDAAH